MFLKILLVFVTLNCVAKESYYHLSNFDIPKEFYTDIDFHPLGYLETYPVKSDSFLLVNESKLKLGCLFIISSDIVIKKYEQDYLLSVNIPVYKLLKFNFPNINKAERGRSHVFLEGVADELRKSIVECGKNNVGHAPKNYCENL